MPEEDAECRHGMDAQWCAICNAPPPVAKKPAAGRATSKPRVEKRELTAADYKLPVGTPFIDTFKGKQHSFLSNFARYSIDFEGETYSTVEHAFQAAKTDVAAEREKIRRLANPQWAKREGMRVTLRSNWDEMRIDVMRDLLRLKFMLPKLAEKLLATGDVPLFEGNWWGDYFWGTVGGVGENHLGILLMEIRAELWRVSDARQPEAD